MRPRAWAWLPVGLTLALYLAACFGADWITDDRPLVAAHLRPGDVLGEWTTPTHEHAANVAGGYLWRPLSSTLVQVWAGLFGRTPAPFRLLNLLLHTLNVLLAMQAARRLGAGRRAAAVVATAWAVHPLLPDAVCWISDVYDLLAAGLLLGGLVVALGGRGAWRALASAALFLLALLAKESALAWLAALPLALLATRGRRLALLHLGPLAATAWLHARWHRAIVGEFRRSALDILREGGFFAAWTDYLRWPLTMPVRAGFTHLVDPGHEPVAWSGVLVALAGLGAWRWRRELAAGVGVWTVMVAPGALAAVGFGQQASRYLYLPLAVALPFLAAVAWPGRRWLLGLLAAGWCLAWLPATVGRIAAWNDELALFSDEVRHEPANPFARKALGRLLVGAGDPARGLAMWAEALEDPPASTFVMDPQQERLDLARAALAFGQPATALAALDAFLAAERAAGRPVDPSVPALRAQVAAALDGEVE